MRYRVVQRFDDGSVRRFDCDDLPGDVYAAPVVSVALLQPISVEALAKKLQEPRDDG